MGARRGITTPDPADRSDSGRSVRDGGDRCATIARWLCQRMPKSANVVELVLSAWVADNEPETLSRWEKSAVSEQLAPEISSLIQDYADDQGQHCKAKLEWVDAEERPYMTKTFRGLCRKEKQLNIAPLDGTLASLLQSNQRHTEAIMETTMRERMAADAARDRDAARMERVLGLFEGLVSRAMDRIAVLEDRAEDAEHTAEEAVAAAEEAAEVAEEATAQAEEKKDGDRIATVLELVGKQLTAG